jgi:hypothetical protein
MTSIEWLLNKLNLFNQIENDYINKLIFEQAKEMHKQEIIDAYTQGDYDVYNGKSYITADTAEQYYQETFVSKGSSNYDIADDALNM